MPAEPSDELARSLRRTILVVDDAPDVLATVAAMLKARLDASVITSASGEEALTTLERHAVDLIISDQRMGGMDGADFLAECARRWPQTPRILLTAYADIETLKRALNAGQITRFLQKPISAETLAREAGSTLEEARRQNQQGTAFDRAMSQLRKPGAGERPD